MSPFSIRGAEPSAGTSSSTRPAGFRTRTLARQWGYRLLPGDSFSYILHMRPREWPIMAAHTALGFFLAAGWTLNAGEVRSLLIGVLVWVVFLNGGTLAINSVFDKDEGDIGYLDAPPPPPRFLLSFSLGLMALGQVVALVLLPTLFSAVYGLCFVMSVVYSVPPFRWKAIAGLDLLINAWGFGTLTPLAGWAITGRPLELWTILTLVAFCPLFAALYPLTQLYQFEEDSARGDRTLALVIGMRASLLLAIGATLLAFGLLGAGALVGPAGRWWPSLVISLATWLAVLLPWYARRERMTTAEHKRGMYAALQAWAVTDVAVLLTFTLL